MKTAPANGFSLIEVLIAVFVLALGVIGAAGMQLAALQTTQQAGFQTSAMHLAAEMADSMRANMRQMRLDDKDNPYLRVDHDAASTASQQNNCYGADGYCDTQQLAEFEIAEWLQRLDAALPGGRVRICRDAVLWHAENSNFSWTCTDSTSVLAPIVIKIGWREKSSEAKTFLEGEKAFSPAIALTVAPYVK
jgi:type IV pilus assembly protein PilV